MAELLTGVWRWATVMMFGLLTTDIWSLAEGAARHQRPGLDRIWPPPEKSPAHPHSLIRTCAARVRRKLVGR